MVAKKFNLREGPHLETAIAPQIAASESSWQRTERASVIVLLPPKWRSIYYPLSESVVLGVAFWGNRGQKAFMLTSISSTAPTAPFPTGYSG